MAGLDWLNDYLYPSLHGGEMKLIGTKKVGFIYHPSPHGDEMKPDDVVRINWYDPYPSPHGDEMKSS